MCLGTHVYTRKKLFLFWITTKLVKIEIFLSQVVASPPTINEHKDKKTITTTMCEDEQNTQSPLLDVILQIGQELEKTNPVVAAKLLSNFNKYNQEELTNMLDKFQDLLERVVAEGEAEDVFVDVYYIVKTKEAELKEIIM